MGWALFWVTSTFCGPEDGRFHVWKKDGSMSGTRHSPMATRERLQCFIPFFPHVLEIAQLDYTRRDSSALGIIRTLSRIDRIYLNVRMAEKRDFHYYSHVFEKPGESDHSK